MLQLTGGVVPLERLEAVDSDENSVLMRPGESVEIAAAETAQHEAKAKAAEGLRETRANKHKEAVDAKIAELKAKLHGHKKPIGTKA
jgi:hypothetical protein